MCQKSAYFGTSNRLIGQNIRRLTGSNSATNVLNINREKDSIFVRFTDLFSFSLATSLSIFHCSKYFGIIASCMPIK